LTTPVTFDTEGAARLLSELYMRKVRPFQIATWAGREQLPRITNDDGKPMIDKHGPL
jgi:hypothetical protein